MKTTLNTLKVGATFYPVNTTTGQVATVKHTLLERGYDKIVRREFFTFASEYGIFNTDRGDFEVVVK